MSNPEAKGNQETNMSVGSTIIDTTRGKFSPGQSINIVYYCLTHFEDVEIETQVPHDINYDNWRNFVNNLSRGRHNFACTKKIEYITPLGPNPESEIYPASTIPRKRIRKQFSILT